MREIEFSKMHGIGNDYIYINCLERKIDEPEEAARILSDRHFSVGGDGLVLILPSMTSDFRMRMFNADGSEGQMCGNAVRCIAKYLFDKGITRAKQIRLETASGEKVLELETENNQVVSVRVNMGSPEFLSSEIPLRFEGAEMVEHPIEVSGESFAVTAVSMGNPHAVIFVDEITDRHIFEIGPVLEHYDYFPNRVNVEFVKVLSPTEVRMRVWERGSGETLACGTGACAVVAAGVRTKRLSQTTTVHLRGGNLEIDWSPDGPIYKTGPAAFSFEGRVTLP